MADLTIKKNLNIVFSAGDFIVHHVPVGYETYRSVAEILGAAVARMLNLGNMWPSTQAQSCLPAYLHVSKMAARMDGDQYDMASDGFLGELQSRTTLIKGGKTFNLYDAVIDGIVDEETRDFIYGQLIFFILTSKREKTKTVEDWAAQIGASITSLTFMEYSNSLTTSTEKGVIG